MISPFQPIMFHKKQNILSRYFASSGKIALGDILPQETKQIRLPIVMFSGPWAGRFGK